MQACRQRAGFSQEEMADKLHRTQACVSKFENDHKIPDLPTMMQWGEVTGTREVIIAFLYGMDGINIMQNLMSLIGG